MMLNQFDDELAGVDLSYAKKHNLDTRDVVTIASILERETKLPSEYRKVASVIYNRLAVPMRLQLCATVLYTLPEGTTVLRRQRPGHANPLEYVSPRRTAGDAHKQSRHQGSEGGRASRKDQVLLLRAHR